MLGDIILPLEHEALEKFVKDAIGVEPFPIECLGVHTLGELVPEGGSVDLRCRPKPNPTHPFCSHPSVASF